jgi:hypothetical protein
LIADILVSDGEEKGALAEWDIARVDSDPIVRERASSLAKNIGRLLVIKVDGDGLGAAKLTVWNVNTDATICTAGIISANNFKGPNPVSNNDRNRAGRMDKAVKIRITLKDEFKVGR